MTSRSNGLMIFIIKEKKLGGILIEHAIQGQNIEYTIAGIGINIKQNGLSWIGLQIPVSFSNYNG